MFRATTLLIVMALAGWPTSSLVCELWCEASAAGNHYQEVGCHDASRGIAGGQHIAAIHDCGEAATFAPFLGEAKRGGVAPALDAALAEPVAVAAAVGATAAWSRVRQVPAPRGPSLHTVLRI
jgi:hypothetical protein